MPVSTEDRTRTGNIADPLVTFKFHVEIENIKEAFFKECSGLEMSTEVFEYNEGGVNGYTHKFPGRTKYSNITLKRGFALSNELFDWFREVEQGLSSKDKKGFKATRRSVTITLYSSADCNVLRRWTLSEAFPVKWVGPSFKTDEAATAIESIEFAHNGIGFDNK